jgi:hypothetical protein
MIAIGWYGERRGRAADLALVLLIPLCLAGCGSARGDNRVQAATDVPPRPMVVYVGDFDVERVDTGSGLLPALAQRHRLLGSLLPGAPKDAAALSRHVVDLMAASLVEDIGKAGIVAVRLPPAGPPPAQGWLLRGVFTEVDQGNRMQRAMIGFGAGQTEIQAVADLEDLAQGPPRPFYDIDANADSRKLPGAIVLRNPYAAAAKFVLAGQDLDRNVRQAAKQIAEAVLARLPK